MDGTQPSQRTSAATRKRRSSILKSQRTARTPLSELEFKVTTPTDTTKSRRVSFSRRTGVAEFATNEATTTWKNVYVEHNKSDSLGNDSDVKQPRSSAVGKNIRIFEQQFEEVETDLIDTFGHTKKRNINATFNNINFTEQLTFEHSTVGNEPKPPTQNFDLSSFTDKQQSHIFGNDFVDPLMGETSGGINVDFSALQPIGATKPVKDDLDEIARDIELNRPDPGQSCSGFRELRDQSQYIEVNVDMTQRRPRNDDSDMSITDTIYSSKNSLSHKDEKEKDLNDDWEMDKENIAFNPYVAPAESDNFAVNKAPEKILVFDGKKLKYASIDADLDELEDPVVKRSSSKGSMANMLILEDEVPSLPEDMEQASTSRRAQNLPNVGNKKEGKSIIYDAQNTLANMAITENLPLIGEIKKNKEIHEDDTNADICVTSCITNKIIENLPPNDRTILYNQENSNAKDIDKRKTIVFENNDADADISVTSCITNKIIENGPPNDRTMFYKQDFNSKDRHKRKTIVFDNDDADANISVTRCITNNIIENVPPNDRTMFYNQQYADVKAENKRKTIVLDKDEANADMSVTRCITNKIYPPIDKTMFFNQEDSNTKDKNKRITIVFDNDDVDADISVTRCITNNIIENVPPNDRTMFYNQQDSDAKAENKRKTIVFDNNDADADISVTSCITNKIIENVPLNDRTMFYKQEDFNTKERHKRKTIVFDNDDADADISVTRCITNNIIENVPPNDRTMFYNQQGSDAKAENKGKTFVFDKENKGKTFVFDKDDVNADISVTRCITNKIYPLNDKTMFFNQEDSDTKDKHKRKTIVYNNDDADADVSVTRCITNNIIENVPSSDRKMFYNQEDFDAKAEHKRKTIVFDKDDAAADVSVTRCITNKIVENVPLPPNDRTMFYNQEHSDANVSVTVAVPIKRIHETTTKLETFGNYSRKTLPTMNTDPFGQDEPVLKRRTIHEEMLSSDVMKLNLPAYQRKTIVLNVHDDLPNFISDTLPQLYQNTNTQGTIIYDREESSVHATSNLEGKMSTTQVVTENVTNVMEISLSQSTIANSRKGNEGESAIPDSDVDRTEEIDGNADLNNVQAMSKNSLAVDSLRIQGQTNTILEKPLKSIIYKDITNLPITLNDDMDQIEDQLMPEPFQNREPESEQQQQPSAVVSKNDDSSTIKKSILSDLLDMSDTSDRYNVTKMNTTQTSGDANMKKLTSDHTSSSSIIPIIRDSEDDMKSIIIDANQDRELKPYGNLDEDIENTKDIRLRAEVEHQLPLPIEFKDGSNDAVTGLGGKLSKLKKVCRLRKTLMAARKALSLKTENDKPVELNTSNSKDSCGSLGKESMMNIDNTKALLEMLSNLTDDNLAQEYDKARSVSLNKRRDSDISIRSEQTEGANNQTSITKRPSVTLSREEMLSNISMAQAILQKSRIEIDESLDDTLDNSADVSKRGKVRIDKDVVKTLHFEDDESLIEINNRSNTRLSSSLKKTAFGETEYMRESCKSKVIPSYLDDLSNDIKHLMGDLVKPMVDIPHTSINKYLTNNPSTCSTQIQANLITSSQVDLDGELLSKPESMVTMHIPTKGNSLIEPAYQNRVDIINTSNRKWHIGEEEPKRQQGHHNQKIIDPSQGQIIYFDQNNPLNNVLLSPYGLMHIDSHRYEPVKSVDTLCTSDIMSPSEKSMSAQVSFNGNQDNEVNIAHVVTKHDFIDCFKNINNSECVGKPIIEEISDMISNTVSNIIKEPSVVLFDESKPMNVKEIEVNTLIAMKPNNELLAESSSLTLVDDALAANKFDADLGTTTRTVTSQDDMKRNNESTSNVKVIYSADGKDNTLSSVKVERAATETEDCAYLKQKLDPTVSWSGKHKHTINCLDTTPKPLKKIQKICLTEYVRTPEKKKTSPKKPKVSPKKSPPRGNITVKQLLSECYKASVEDHSKETTETLKEESLLKSSEFIEQLSCKKSESSKIGNSLSFTSSKNAPTYTHNDASKASESTSYTIVGKDIWECEFQMPNDTYPMAEVVGKIDELPFMGTDECKWENMVGDKWSLLLLHGRVRLIVTFARDAADGRVTPDTPIRDIEIEIAKIDKTPVALLCVRFCAECMQWVAMRTRASGAAAGALLPLVRRCAAAARVARAWGRLMIHTYAHLAYTLTEDGRLTLKVANVPLRSVWEVSMSVQMQSGDTTAGGAPRPLASDVRVTRVLSAYEVGEEEVHRVVTHVTPDWRHVPNTIWKIFKHLKQRESDSL